MKPSASKAPFLPRFSVIVPTYQRPEQLALCLASLAQQDTSPEQYEVIVVDDAGVPSKLEFLALAEYPFALRLLSQQRGGAATARNAGAQVALGQMLAFTDDDCQPATDWLAVMGEQMKRNGDNVLVGGRVVNSLTNDPYARASQALVDFLYEQLNREPQQACLLTSNNFCVSAAAFRALGGFDTTFRGAGGEDRELCLRWRHAGHRLVYAPELLVNHAHYLNLMTFLRQHYAYGKGAAWLRRRAEFHGYGPLPLQQPSFYWELLRYPRRAARGPDSLQQTLLFALSQVANTAGYITRAVSDAR